MKSILRIIPLAFLFLVACEKDETMMTIRTDIAAPAITSQADGFTKTITEASLGDAIKFQWSPADYGVDTEITYTLQMDSSGRGFANPVVLGTTTTDTLVIKLSDLNDKLLNTLGVTPNVASAIELRVTAAMHNNKYPEVSEVIHIQLTPWATQIKYPAVLYIPGGYQQSGGDPSKADALTLYTLPGTDSLKVYEGYVTIPGSTWIKFTTVANWGGTNYGSGGSGILSPDGNAGGIDVPAAGYYKIRVDIAGLTYSITRIDSWGVVGDATPGSWFDSTPMTYNAATKTWSVTVNLVNGALKFRANNGWDVNYGPVNSNVLAGILTQTDAGIGIPASGSYTVTADFSRSKAPFVYTYSIVKN
ncbi:MAG TPA: SusE domain-containing protein [Ohtaekwangia sp.]|uniref:SusE domain-containing protein n=1 Tax=Ohtaekwangia sp. TaxID=2066019 RepID=UPI002F958674